MDGWETLDRMLPRFLREMLAHLDPTTRQEVEELRLREGFPLAICRRGEEWVHPLWRARPLAGEDLSRVLETAGGGSVHTILEQLRSGYVTAPGGIRLGICGEGAVQAGELLSFRRVTSLALRVPHALPGVAAPLLPALCREGRLQSTLLLSPPGVGKTTLLRVIQGLQRPNAGEVKIGKTVRFAVLSQHLDDLSELGDDRVRQVIGRYSRRTMLDGKEMTPAQLLEKLGFKRADLNEPVKDLSGGQKRRLALMLILLDEPNVLILDEPGNDLDTDMLAVVEDLLDAWPGTLLLVTHDRYLMERVTDHQFALVNGKIRHLPGGVEEYLRLSDASPSSMTAGSPARQRPAHAADSGLSGTEASPESSRLSGGEQRTLRKLMQSNERKVETLNGKIEDVRASMAAADPTDFTALGDFQAQISDLQQQIDALEEEWMEAAEKLGE